MTTPYRTSAILAVGRDGLFGSGAGRCRASPAPSRCLVLVAVRDGGRPDQTSTVTCAATLRSLC